MRPGGKGDLFKSHPDILGFRKSSHFLKRQNTLTGPERNKNINIFIILKHLDCEVTWGSVRGTISSHTDVNTAQCMSGADEKEDPLILQVSVQMPLPSKTIPNLCYPTH